MVLDKHLKCLVYFLTPDCLLNLNLKVNWRGSMNRSIYQLSMQQAGGHPAFYFSLLPLDWSLWQRPFPTQVWPWIPPPCILFLDGERLKENCAFFSVLYIKHLNEITDMNSSIMGKDASMCSWKMSLPFPEDTYPTSKVHEKDSGAVPAPIQCDPLESAWSSHHSALAFLLNLSTKGGNHSSSF